MTIGSRSARFSRAKTVLASASLLGAVLTIGTYVTTASAMDAKTEEAAKKADQEAMDIDFLSLDMKKAKTKLQGALKKCGKICRRR